jgi:two-component system, cell cycle response regulator
MGIESSADPTSDRDALTGAPTRKAFMAGLESAAATAHATGSAFALLYIDIDNMKRFNLHNGHLAGDAMLKRFVEQVEPLLTNRGALSRVGGDEFAIILPDADGEQSLILAHQICDLARNDIAPPQPIHCGDPHCHGPAKISASIGMGLFDPSMTTESFLRKVEENMYQAKCEGRNRVSR